MAKTNVVKLMNVRSREKWVELINNAWREQVTSIFETGALLEAAKEELAHGEWTALFRDGGMPFSKRTAEMLIAIANNQSLRNAKHVSHLPAQWGTLYELTKLTDAQFADGIKSGAINPKMQRKEVAELRGIEPKPKPPKKKESTRRSCDDWCDDISVLITEAAATLEATEKSEFFTYLREVIGSLESQNA